MKTELFRRILICMKKRASGILLHITSLPGKYGIGDLGPEAFKFADFLRKSGQTYWQILPLTHPNTDVSWSPYDCLSAFAGNTMLISPDLLYKSGLLDKSDIADVPGFPQTQIQFKEVYRYKTKLLNKAYENFIPHESEKDFKLFCRENSYWLDDYTLFAALVEKYKTSDWSKWPKIIIDEDIKLKANREKVLQFLFFRQWFSLKEYCNSYGIKFIGDIPIYVAYKSSDVWANQDIFKLDKSKKPAFKSGVPPDYFSKTGQLWGNPIYNWSYIKKTKYQWWMERVRQNLKLFDMVRIDHFRGLVKFWQVPARHKTAMNGKWMPGPGEDFFKVLFRHFPDAQLIVEDLGMITPDVRELIKKLDLTGMKVLQFAFNDNHGKNSFLPHNHFENCVVYTGTHDNNTIRGWFSIEASNEQKKNLFAYLGRKVPIRELNWEMIKLAMSSVAKTAIVPVQDILNLPSDARMNNPAKTRSNWGWRLKEKQITAKFANKLAKVTSVYGRAR